MGVMQVYARMTFQRRWRKWLTDNLVDRWLTAGRYYQLNLVSGDHQNPEYRIADDVRIATEAPVDFVTGVTDCRCCRPRPSSSCCGRLAVRSSFSLARRQIYIPGFLVIAAVIYALVASGSMVRHRPALRRRVREQKSIRGRAALRPHAVARERRKHRAYPRRRGGARRRRPLAQERCFARGATSVSKT